MRSASQLLALLFAILLAISTLAWTKPPRPHSAEPSPTPKARCCRARLSR